MTQFDDDTQVWADPAWNQSRPVPTASHRKTARGGPRVKRTRSHHVVPTSPPPQRRRVARQAKPLPYDYRADLDELDGLPPATWGPVDHWIEPEHAGRHIATGVDPRLLRMGALATVGTLMIPLALAIRVDRDEPVLSGATTTAPSTTVTAPTPTAAPVTTVTVTLPATAPAPVAVAAVGQASAAKAVPATAAPACAGTYTVIFNDFWNRFPKTSGASVEEWLAANDATLDTPLYVGDELCIPVGATAPAPPPTTTEVPTTAAAPPPVPTVTTPAPTVPPATAAPVTTAAPVITNPPPPPPPALTAAAAASPAAVVPPPAGSRPTPAQVEAMIREIWPDDIEERAVTIAKRESGLNPTVHNFCCYGVFAIYFEMGKSWLAGLGVTSAEQLFDARTNIMAAYKLYTLSGWTPWRQTDPGA